MKRENFTSYIENTLSRGEVLLSKDRVLKDFAISDVALRNRIKRQIDSHKLIYLTRGYYLIIPPEYKNLGFVPPELFINDLMEALSVPYYVSLLSAASFYGATHQASQYFQVMTDRVLEPISLGRTKINFYVNKHIKDTPKSEISTDRGPLIVSSIEATCFDLLRYPSQSGQLNHIATVIKDLIDHVDIKKLKFTASVYPLIYCQRLGYLLELMEFKNESESLYYYLKDQKPNKYSYLVPGSESTSAPKNERWHLLINEHIEPDF